LGAIFQSQVPDLTPYLPWLGMLALAAWKVWEMVKTGRKAERDDRSAEVTRALLPVERRAQEAEKLLELTEKHKALEEAEKLRLLAKCERLEQRLAEQNEIEDKLQSTVNSIQGRLDELERREKDEVPRRGR
jgi:hypothetical protein